MRLKVQTSFWLAAALALLVIACAGSNDASKDAGDGLDMYFRDGDLLALTDQSLPVYPDAMAGESKTLARDFPRRPSTDSTYG